MTCVGLNEASTRRDRVAQVSSDEFAAAYDAVLAQWPVAFETLDIASRFGTTRVYAAGPPVASPLVLFHGAGATASVWFANIGVLSRAHRVYAVDCIYDKGRSVPSANPVQTREDAMGWLDAVLDALEVAQADFCGHSYGCWLAVAYALHARQRVHRLVLLDPTTLFVGFRPSYLLHALPTLVASNPRRQRGFLAWETGGRPLNPAWETVKATPAGGKSPRFVMPKRPTEYQLGSLPAALVILAERSRAINPARAAEVARRLLPNVRVEFLAGASHHSIPTEDAAVLNAKLMAFLSNTP